MFSEKTEGQLTDIEITGRVAESILGLANGRSVVGEDSTSKCETTTSLVNLLEDVLPISILVDVDGKNRAKDLVVE